MSPQLFVTGLFLISSVSVFAADATFQLVKQDEKISVYGKRPENCVSDGASVMFVVENRTKERLELNLELLNLKVKNKLKVMVEPSGNTSVLSLSPGPEACHVELVDMTVNPVVPKPAKTLVPASTPAIPVPATDAKPANPLPANRVM